MSHVSVKTVRKGLVVRANGVYVATLPTNHLIPVLQIAMPFVRRGEATDLEAMRAALHRQFPDKKGGK